MLYIIILVGQFDLPVHIYTVFVHILKKFGFNSFELKSVNSCYVRPALEYTNVEWHYGLIGKQIDDIESIQRRECKIIWGHTSNSYRDNQKICKLDTLADRRLIHCTNFTKSLSKNTRTCLLLSPTWFENQGRCLRNSHKLSQIPSRTTRFNNSPIPFLLIF